jgi:D-inositol-3-phosphate glycosyltransferase
VTVTNAFMRDAIVANGADPSRIALVQHGVDTERFRPGPGGEAFRRAFGLGTAPVVLSPRAIRPLYRHDTVLAAFAAATDDAVLVMSALGADPGALAALRRQAVELGIADRVRILDRIEADDLPDAYRAAAVVVSVPESDSFPVTVQEAMASGVPLVVGDLPPTRAVMAPLLPEALVPIGDVEATAARLRHALGLDPVERDRIASIVRGWAVREADYITNMRRMETLYRGLVGR